MFEVHSFPAYLVLCKVRLALLGIVLNLALTGFKNGSLEKTENLASLTFS